MKLIIIKGTSVNAWEFIETAFQKKTDLYTFTKCCTIESVKEFIEKNKDIEILIDYSNRFHRKILNYLKSKATEIKTISIKIKRCRRGK